MRSKDRPLKIFLALILAGILSSCAVGPAGAPHYDVVENPVPPDQQAPLRLDPRDQNYTMRVDDRTPFGLQQLPGTVNMLYQKGYDNVRRDREADFAIDVILTSAFRDNPNVRGANMLGGALAGAAAGAIIGGATGHPGTGAAIGAASGGVLGAAALPADTPMVRIDVTITSMHDRVSSQRSRTIDLAGTPPQDVQFVVDREVTRILDSLPRR
ncbi:MAG: glycine zipper family protein [Syntrophobacteraceae bacterium]|nr:hypothetical protein [Desulfobacteraceae bacterium]